MFELTGVLMISLALLADAIIGNVQVKMRGFFFYDKLFFYAFGGLRVFIFMP